MTPNICLLEDNYNIVFEPEINETIIFYLSNTAYQAEKNMTWRQWALSKYYNTNCNLIIPSVSMTNDLKTSVENLALTNNSNNYKITPSGWSGRDVTPAIYLDSLIIENQVYNSYYSGQ